MASPEIDEAAAVAWFKVQAQSGWTNRENAARAALAWKARTEARAEELVREHGEVCIVELAQATARAEELKGALGLAQLATEVWKARAEAAEAKLAQIQRGKPHSCDLPGCASCGNGNYDHARFEDEYPPTD